MPKKAHKPLVEDIETEEEWLDLLKTEVQTWIMDNFLKRPTK